MEKKNEKKRAASKGATKQVGMAKNEKKGEASKGATKQVGMANVQSVANSGRRSSLRQRRHVDYVSLMRGYTKDDSDDDYADSPQVS
ncbi:hypothetical protein DVH05_024578 [Phytophthora capsici]|nr:hypothetical protein DVH05_023532 [Phytophthora capsici]KAG1707926.1 hypothetical protein DVH05_024578 [Phytophthora capsici]